MNKIMEFMEKYFIPVAAKIGSQRHLVAIRDGFVAIMPIIIAGSFAILINNVPITGYNDFMVSIFGAGWKSINGAIWNGSFAVMSLLVVMTTAYSLARSYDKDGLAAAVTSFTCLLMFYAGSATDWAIPYAYLGSQGLFVALIVALVFGTIFSKLLGNPKLLIKMPDGVPPAVAKSFAALFPTIITVVIAGIVQVTLLWVFGWSNVHQVIFDAIQKPLQSFFTDSIGPLLVLLFLQQLLWFFGLHGSNILGPIFSGVLLPLTLENVAAVEAGKAAPHAINSVFVDIYVNMGGSGTTICLLIAIFLFSKNKANKTIANLGLAPGLFNINEPVLFGMPIVLNPIYLVPFIVVPMVSALIGYFATVSEIVSPVVATVPWTTPPVISAFMATASFTGALVALVNIAVGVVIYMPFVLMSDRKAALEESQGLAQ